jgi:voltage-gated potassium channel
MKLFHLVRDGLRWVANAPRLLIGCYLGLIVVCGWLYSYFEEKGIGDSMWWAVVTASTVGYGDISPGTWQARTLAAILISIMILLVIPLITAHFASKLIVNNDAFQHEEQEEIKEQLREIRVLTQQLAGELAAERRLAAERAEPGRTDAGQAG